MKPAVAYTLLVSVLLTLGCSSQSPTWSSKAYHNLTAHYNGYYYALEEIGKIEQTIWKSNADDYNRILRLFPSFDSTLAKSYEKEIEEAVKMASIAIQRHSNSKWVDDAYILVGRARFYSLDWGNAIQTFKFVNTKSEDPNARHRAIINLIRTFTEHKEYNNAQAAIDYLLKQKLSKTNKKDLLLEKAYFHQVQDDYDNMVRSLTAADPLLTKKDKPGRIYFIIGQVYQDLGFESEAFNYYKKCLATNPDYEIDFYARLYMAQVAEISRSRDVNAARRSFRKMLKDRKNKEFRDKIFYEMGVFELKQKNLTNAVSDFNSALREGNNSRIKGEAYLKLGEIYYDTLRDYELSQAYYDSAISALPNDYEGYESIKARQEILNEFVKHLKTIKWQDSLLTLATLDSAALRGMVDSVFAAKKKQEELAAGKKKKRSNRVELASSNPGSIFEDSQGTSEAGDWYFGNPSAVALGETEFKRVWGNIPLEDNWRRSLKISLQATQSQPLAESNDTTTPEESVAAGPTDPVLAEFERLNNEIPRTEEEKSEALKKIEDAYFNLGDIYYFKLEEKKNAVTMYEKLLDRFPASEHEPEVLYKLYLIYKETEPAKAQQFASRLNAEYPQTSFAKILNNPDYLKESSQAAEKQKMIYKEAYRNFQSGNYEEATRLIEEANSLGQTGFSPNLKLLSILIAGQTSDITSYQYALQEFVSSHPDSEVTPYAEKLLKASHDFQLKQEKQKGIQYIASFEEPHYFVIVYQRTLKLEKGATSTLETFNETYFKDLNLKTSNLTLSDAYTLTMVSELPSVQAANEYYKAFTDGLSSLPELRNYKFSKFVITKDNFDIFYRTKGLDEYLRFFEKNYREKNQ